MTKFQIGDVVYCARVGSKQVWITCPECLGSGRLRVILGDDSEVSIACVCCERGYEGSPGRIQTYQYVGEAVPYLITGVQVRGPEYIPEVTYAIGSGSCYTKEAELFQFPDEAASRAEALVAEHEAEEKRRLGYKEKQHRTWAWNVSYWRGEIRRAKEAIARCEARLAVAPKNRKESAQRDAEEAV
jgi:hypothetical protein